MNIRDSSTKEPTFDREPRDQVFHSQQTFFCACDRRDLFLIAAQQLHWLWVCLATHFAQLWHGSQQRFGIGMLRVFENLFDRAFFDLVAPEHNNHAVRHLRDHRHVMGDKHNGSAGFPL